MTKNRHLAGCQTHERVGNMQQLLHIKNTKHLSEERFVVESEESLYDELTYSEAMELFKALKEDPYQGCVELYLRVSA